MNTHLFILEADRTITLRSAAPTQPLDRFILTVLAEPDALIIHTITGSNADAADQLDSLRSALYLDDFIDPRHRITPSPAVLRLLLSTTATALSAEQQHFQSVMMAALRAGLGNHPATLLQLDEHSAALRRLDTIMQAMKRYFP